jgi:membrane protein implicated in regulation of membrane protease activity
MDPLLQLDLVGPETLPLLLLTAGLLLSLAEALAPGANFIVIGAALIAAGGLGLALGSFGLVLSPFVLALFVLFFGVVAFYGYRDLDIYGGKGQQQTRDSDALRGATGRVTERVTPTGGEVKLSSGGFNPYYSARSPRDEIPEGTEVMVVDPGGGNVVTVESVGEFDDEIDRELARERAAEEEPGDGTEAETGAGAGSGPGAGAAADAETERN